MRKNITCMKCYCFICDKPASECEEWFNPERPNALNEHHCNAYPSKDSPHWQVKKWLKLNPVQNLLVNLTNPKDSDGTTQQKGTPYEWGDHLDPSQRLAVMINITKEYFRKFNIIMTKKTQLKIMIATKIMSFDNYVYTNFQNNNIFPV